MIKLQIEKLEEIFDYFNHKKFDEKFLVKPVITIQTSGRSSALGWCTIIPIWEDLNKNVYYEINITAEHLGDGLLNVSETMLHEMCHLSNIQDKINDCNPKTQYHNKNFKKVAESVGLKVEKDKRCGYGITSLSEELKDEVLEMGIEDVFNIRRVSRIEGEKEKDKPKTKKVFKYICGICGTDIKSKCSGLEIVCKKCEVLFDEKE